MKRRIRKTTVILSVCLTVAWLILVIPMFHYARWYGLYCFQMDRSDVSAYREGKCKKWPHGKYLFAHIPEYEELGDTEFVDFNYQHHLYDECFFREGMAAVYVGVKYSHERYLAEKEKLSGAVGVHEYVDSSASDSDITGGVVLESEKLPWTIVHELARKLMLYSGDHVYRLVMYSDEYKCIYYVSVICRLNDPRDHKTVFEMARDGLPLRTDVSEFAEQMEKKYQDSIKQTVP